MKTISNYLENSLIIKKSKFIACLYPLVDEDKVKEIVEQIRKDHPKSRHVCYAYIIGEKMAYSDDGEPAGTAGSRVLEMMKLKEMDYTLAIIIRYFGGVKLGTGPLAKAYQDVVSTAIESKLKDFSDSIIIEVITTYDEAEQIKRGFKEYIISETYDQKVSLRLNIPKDIIETFSYKYKPLEESIYIKKSS